VVGPLGVAPQGDGVVLFFVRVNQVLVRLWTRVMWVDREVCLASRCSIACLTGRGCFSDEVSAPVVGRRGFRGADKVLLVVFGFTPGWD